MKRLVMLLSLVGLGVFVAKLVAPDVKKYIEMSRM